MKDPGFVVSFLKEEQREGRAKERKVPLLSEELLTVGDGWGRKSQFSSAVWPQCSRGWSYTHACGTHGAQ